MDGTYLVTRKGDHVFSYLLCGSKAIEIHCDEAEGGSILDQIYIGKVQKIVKNIGAAFVEIRPDQVCYLPLDDLKHPVYTKKGTSQQLQAGDELLVQVKRDGIKTKAPALTTNLTFYGKYALLTTGNHQISVSSKLSAKEKERLIRLASEQSPDSGRAYGWLLRTNAGEASDQQIRQDLEKLEQQYRELMKTAQYRTCFSCLMKRPSAYVKRFGNLYSSQVKEFLTDDRQLYEEITQYLQENQPEDQQKLRLYEDRMIAMEKLYSLERHLKEALSERVWLNSGGYLVIQPTEALTAVDVNTGKFTAGKKKEESFLKLNQEAAVEIARQIRLRNLSGIILVDFINMEKKESEAALLALMEEELKKDPIRAQVVDMTKLSLVEITRMKKERPLHETAAFLRKRSGEIEKNMQENQEKSLDA